MVLTLFSVVVLTMDEHPFFEDQRAPEGMSGVFWNDVWQKFIVERIFSRLWHCSESCLGDSSPQGSVCASRSRTSQGHQRVLWFEDGRFDRTPVHESVKVSPNLPSCFAWFFCSLFLVGDCCNISRDPFLFFYWSPQRKVLWTRSISSMQTVENYDARILQTGPGMLSWFVVWSFLLWQFNTEKSTNRTKWLRPEI